MLFRSPSLSLGAPEQATPFSTQPIPGEILTYDSLQIQFLIDSEMVNYKAIYNWMIGLGFPENYLQYQALSTATENPLAATAASSKFGTMINDYSDAVLEILGSQNTTSQTILFRDLHPVSLSSLPFTASATDVNYLIGTAIFRYTYYDFV